MVTRTGKDEGNPRTRPRDPSSTVVRGGADEAMPAPAPKLTDLATLIREAQSSLDLATRQRAGVIRQADLRIARGKQRIAALQAEQARLAAAAKAAAEAKEEAPLPPPERPKRKRK